MKEKKSSKRFPISSIEKVVPFDFKNVTKLYQTYPKPSQTSINVVTLRWCILFMSCWIEVLYKVMRPAVKTRIFTKDAICDIKMKKVLLKTDEAYQLLTKWFANVFEIYEN